MRGSAGRRDRLQGRILRRRQRPGVTLDVIGYDEQILVPGKLETDSTLTFWLGPDG